MQIIIPMSGVGQRFLDAGYKTPKPLIKVDGKTIIEHVCNLFPKESNYIFICNKFHLKNTNMKKELLRLKPNSQIVAINPHKFGPVYAISKVFNLINDDDETIVSYCDYGTKWNYFEFLKTVRNKKADGAIPSYTGFHPHMLGNNNYAFIKEKNKWLIKIKEKESFTKNKMNEFASNGTYYFKKGIYIKKYFQELLKKKIKVENEFYVSLVYNLLVKDKLKVLVYKIENMLQWGTPFDLNEYIKWSNYFKKKNIKKNNYSLNKNTINLMLLAGRGLRYVREGFKKPKPLIKINGKPMFIRAMKSLPISKQNFFVCKKKHIEKYYLKNIIKKHFPKSKIISLNKHTQGQASTCEKGLNNQNIHKEVLIGTSDADIIYNHKAYNKLLRNKKNQIIVFCFKNSISVMNKPNDYTFVKVDKNNYVKDVSEKKKISNTPYKDHAILGIFYFRKIKFFLEGMEEVYKRKHKINNEFYIDSIIKFLAKKKYKIKIFNVDHYIGWGTPNDLRVYYYWQKYFLNS